MKVVKNIYILLAFVLFAVACNEEDREHFLIDEPTSGGVIDIEFKAGAGNFDVTDLSKPIEYTLTGRDFESGGLIDHAEIYVVHVSAGGTTSDSVLFLDYTETETVMDVQTSIQELVDIIDSLSSTDDIQAGDQFNFYINEVVMKNGDVFTPENTSDGLVAKRADFAWTSFVACPFVPEDVEGTYEVTSHLFGDNFFGGTDGTGTTREVVAGPGPNQITIVGGAFPTYGGEDLIVTVDPASGIGAYGGDGEVMWDAENPNIGGLDGTYTDADGFVFSCIGFIDLEVVASCCISNFITLEKQ